VIGWWLWETDRLPLLLDPYNAWFAILHFVIRRSYSVLLSSIPRLVQCKCRIETEVMHLWITIIWTYRDLSLLLFLRVSLHNLLISFIKEYFWADPFSAPRLSFGYLVLIFEIMKLLIDSLWFIDFPVTCTDLF